MLNNFTQLQASCGLSNSECGHFLSVRTRSIGRWRETDNDAQCPDNLIEKLEKLEMQLHESAYDLYDRIMMEMEHHGISDEITFVFYKQHNFCDVDLAFSFVILDPETGKKRLYSYDKSAAEFDKYGGCMRNMINRSASWLRQENIRVHQRMKID